MEPFQVEAQAQDHRFDAIARKVESGTRIDESDAEFLLTEADFQKLGALADRVNRKKNGGAVYYNINRHINPTNICALSCKFCAYSRKPGEEGGYAYSIEEILERVAKAEADGATEIHMVGGLHPQWRHTHFLDILRAIKTQHPRIHIKAFTAVELDWLARRSRITVEELIIQLKEAGLGSLPGGGAEIFHQDVRDEITAKLTGEQWIDIHRQAHNLGLHSNCTMLYGHVETPAHRVDHMRYLRELQDETKGFNAFIPLAFQPHNNEMGIDRYTSGVDDLRTIATARIYLDNFQHIKAYWIMLGQDIAQVALGFGANDLDGTVCEEKISNMAGSQAGMVMSRPQIEDMIRRTGREPRERDTLYRPVERTQAPCSTASSGAKSSDAKSGCADINTNTATADLEVWSTQSLSEFAECVTKTREALSGPKRSLRLIPRDVTMDELLKRLATARFVLGEDADVQVAAWQLPTLGEARDAATTANLAEPQRMTKAQVKVAMLPLLSGASSIDPLHAEDVAIVEDEMRRVGLSAGALRAEALEAT